MPRIPKGPEISTNEIYFAPGGRWVTSKLNMSNLVKANVRLPERVIIRDDTLRSGENTPTVSANLEGKMKIARMLEEAGVPEIEAGYVGIPSHRKFFRALKKNGITMKLGAHVRLWNPRYREEIDQAVDAGVDVLNIISSASHYNSYSGLQGIPPEDVPERIYDCITYARSRGIFTAYSLMDQPTLDVIYKCYDTAREAGANRVYVADSKGWLTPESIKFLVAYVKDITANTQVAIHCHNDFGLATSNTIEALKAGAEVADVVVNGLGHRCGNASLEQVVLALLVLYNHDTGIRPEKLVEISKLVGEVYGYGPNPNLPLVGDWAYHYAGNHLAAALSGNWFIWENVRAETLGRKRTLHFGPTALQEGAVGPIAIKLDQMGVKYTQGQLDEITKRVAELIKKNRFITDEELESITKEILRSG